MDCWQVERNTYVLGMPEQMGSSYDDTIVWVVLEPQGKDKTDIPCLKTVSTSTSFIPCISYRLLIVVDEPFMDFQKSLLECD